MIPEQITKIEQPEAIQKAVEALEAASAYITPSTDPSGEGGSVGDYRYSCNVLRMVQDAHQALTSHQSELEALKAKLSEVKKCLKTTRTSLKRVTTHRDELAIENADLRRAVVDLADCLDTEHNDAFNTHESLSDTVRDNASIIVKAKAVHNV